LAHNRPFFTYLRARWQDLLGARFEVLLYDLTSCYFQSDAPQYGKRKHGYSRDKRPDCVQVVIALIVTPEGFSLASEVVAGNTADNTGLHDFQDRIEEQYGKARADLDHGPGHSHRRGVGPDAFGRHAGALPGRDKFLQV
jgi:hypothetical protein